MTAIIFGANGQDGYYLNQLLSKYGINVIGVSNNGNFIKLNISKYEDVSSLINKFQPNYIFHLAANSTTKHEAVFENHETISTGTLNILEATYRFSPLSKVFISGSGLQFENKGVPIKETDSFEARDAYSVSRIQSVFASRYYRKLGLQTYVGYFFNHDSPRRGERHISKKIANFAKSITESSYEKLQIGDVNTRKEWTYAGDIVDGIWTLINQNKIYEANIGSGLGYTIEDWLNACFKLIGKDWKNYIEIIEGFQAEYQQLISDSSLIHSLGWKPKTSFSELAEMMMIHE